MNQRDNVAGSFLLGSFLGALVGGAIGALLASRRYEESLVAEDEAKREVYSSQTKLTPGKQARLRASEQARIETARRSLEDKIAQLNETIDDVRQQLGKVNNSLTENGDRQLYRESTNSEF